MMVFKKKINGREALVFLCFLFVSFCLWLLKAMNERFETDIVVDVVVVNIPADVEFENQDAIGVEVFVRDRGTELLDYKIGNSPQIRVDFNELTDNGNGLYAMHFSSLENRISNALKSSSTFLHFKNDYLSLQLKRERVTLPVRLNYDVETKKHFELAAVETSVKEITVTAPSSRIKEWDFVELPEFVVRNLDKDSAFIYTLPQEKYVNYEPAKIDVFLSVSPYVSGMVTRRVHLVNRLFDLDLSNYCDIPDSVVISYLAPASVAGNINSNDFRVELDFVELTGGKNDSVYFKLAASPLSVEKSDVRIIPAGVRRKNIFERIGFLLGN